MQEKLPQSYLALRGAGRFEFTQKKSRFIGVCANALTQEEAAGFLEGVAKEYPDASAVLWAYACGYNGQLRRFSDSHEPQGGLQILEAITRRGLCGVAVAVVRYFGGVKLGAGPLGRAFGEAAAGALDEAGAALLTRSIYAKFTLPYEALDSFMYYISHSPFKLEEASYASRVDLRVFLEESGEEELRREVSALTKGAAEMEIIPAGYAAWGE